MAYHWIAQKRTAPNYFPDCRIHFCITADRFNAVAAPLPHISSHVGQPQLVGAKNTDGRCCCITVFDGIVKRKTSLPGICLVLSIYHKIGTPGVLLVGVFSILGCMLPFPLCRQALLFPACVGKSIIP